MSYTFTKVQTRIWKDIGRRFGYNSRNTLALSFYSVPCLIALKSTEIARLCWSCLFLSKFL